MLIQDLFAENQMCGTEGTTGVLRELCDGKSRCHAMAITSVLDPQRSSDCDTNIARKLAFSFHCKRKCDTN